MNPVKVVLVTALAGGISIGAAVLGQRWLDQGADRDHHVGLRGGTLDQLPDFRLSDLGGREHTSNAWAGRPLVLNFWAVWCPDCAEELPRLERFASAHATTGLAVVAIAVDRPETTRAFLAEHPLDLTVLLADLEAIDLARRLGNRVEGLPFTVAFDARGRRIFSHTGVLDQAQFEQLAARLADDPASAR
ncbi:alkyl hydroperoxide reductase [Marichromatium purpuratum 984]|uniref:Alkyl hydroperoxide reductase n=1 Tax=Marichromatium purpuratum 984 TaxID=765910 RepID=W0DVJ3_MARPU|nr:TlpA disulfide reductase family protein [Marichromatium purpuratum]AHF02610.1 alkyl hydroperoxide reductase [Marichromatium purpuratum 984]